MKFKLNITPSGCQIPVIPCIQVKKTNQNKNILAVKDTMYVEYNLRHEGCYNALLPYFVELQSKPSICKNEAWPIFWALIDSISVEARRTSKHNKPTTRFPWLSTKERKVLRFIFILKAMVSLLKSTKAKNT